MATAYSEFDTTPANLVADMKTKILLSADWANITGNIVKATTTRGAQMVVDLANAAASAYQMSLAVYRTHDGTTGVDKIVRYSQFRIDAGTALTSDPVHCRVSAGKEHLFFSVEGPRRGEPNPDDTTNGSPRSYFWLSDLVPYHTGDTTAAVVLIAGALSNTNNSAQAVRISRNAADTQSWVYGSLLSLTPPQHSDHSDTTIAINYQRIAAGDSNKVYLAPYVVVEDVAGLRGRLAKVFFAGFSQIWTAGDPMIATLSQWSYDGETYIVVPTARHRATAVNSLAFGLMPTSATYGDAGPLIAIPYA